MALIPLLLVVAPPGRAATTGPNAILRWAATNGAGQQAVTADQAVADAKNYSVIVALQKTFPPYLASMRAANPSLKVLAYLNGAYAQSDQGPSSGWYPTSWYATNQNGAYVRASTTGNYLMDVGNSQWAANRAQTCASYISQSGYDGCYLDMLGNASLDPAYVNNPPVNPRTGLVWTYPDFMGATAGIASTVKAGNAGRMITGNGLSNGNEYIDPASGPTSKLIGPLDAANAQGFVRNENAAITTYRNAKRWGQDVDMLVDAGARGKAVLAMTKVGVTATPAQLLSWQRYALATFLLGTDGRQYFYFDPDGNNAAAAYDHPDLHAFVGMPTAAYSVRSGVYIRPFSSGLAAVNPTASTVTVSLGATYKDLDGNTTTSVTLAPNTGMVFTK